MISAIIKGSRGVFHSWWNLDFSKYGPSDTVETVRSSIRHFRTKLFQELFERNCPLGSSWRTFKGFCTHTANRKSYISYANWPAVGIRMSPLQDLLRNLCVTYNSNNNKWSLLHYRFTLLSSMWWWCTMYLKLNAIKTQRRYNEKTTTMLLQDLVRVLCHFGNTTAR